jgi:hypothetical protein
VGKTNVLTGSSIASFTPDNVDKIELHTNLQRITDARGPRVVVHEFPNKDGAVVETLGRKPHRTTWTLTFTGPDWIATLKKLTNGFDTSPSGLLVHPIYGQMRVVCHGFEQSVVDIVNAADTITLDLVFTEDTSLLTVEQEQQGIAAKQQAVTSAVSDFQTVLDPYTDQNTTTAGAALSSNASNYSSSSFTAASTNTVDPSLGAQLDSVGAALAVFSAAISVDSLALSSVAQSYDVLAAAEVVYAACLDMADEVALETSGLTEYTVPGTTSIAVLAAARYGNRAISVIDQILTLNADVIADATAIRAGTVLLLPP